jgi:hypothetical protein
VPVAYGQKIELIDPEHDRYEWVSPEEAIRRCAPDVVANCLKATIAAIRTEAAAKSAEAPKP